MKIESKQLTGIIVVVVLAVVAFTGLKIFKKLLTDIGLLKSQEGKDYDENTGNANSFWSPLFWQQGPDNTKILTTAACEKMYKDIYKAFGVFNDDESAIYAVFKRLRTQSQLSYFSWWVNKNKNTDLLRWLHGGNYGPVGDHLSVSEIAVITNFIKDLPKYKY